MTTILPEILREFMLVRSMFTVTFHTIMAGEKGGGVEHKDRGKGRAGGGG